MSTDTDALVPVAWLEHEWAGTGARHLHFDRCEPTVRDEVVKPVWTPLYGPDTIERLTRERDEAVARERERCARICEGQLIRSDKIATPEDCADAIRSTKVTT